MAMPTNRLAGIRDPVMGINATPVRVKDRFFGPSRYSGIE
jgi:hypothetical protein